MRADLLTSLDASAAELHPSAGGLRGLNSSPDCWPDDLLLWALEREGDLCAIVRSQFQTPVPMLELV